jgi:U2 small nuclear ribonucleoprotein B''
MAAPNTTIYIKNLNDRISKDELRAQLYALFLPYGQILDVVALKTAKMRGQAFVVFADMATATTALRAWHGESFYDKPMVRFPQSMPTLSLIRFSFGM